MCRHTSVSYIVSHHNDKRQSTGDNGDKTTTTLFAQRQRQRLIGCGIIICRRQPTHAQAHELHFALCIVVRRRQHTTMRAISYHAQSHELSISHPVQAHELLITAATTTHVDDEILRASAATATTTTLAMMTPNVDDKASGASARHFHIASSSGNDDNNNYRQQ